ncbi:5-formyltetrahydrofolate cyclo-ligase [Desulfosporosinus sp. BICA1-9]|uniref:5-formyltetrahydrofolate cyclo-ligase n=1 Tax=Desulfosporosinus sp. BICA1-9 TaxID=1531958 RepID=UPI00054C212F|nr:5-formyltetrahydrofolate cyclo-ligase [Desulfosporosinus sp. BICA1-9]KJS49496.1 MAG: 5-formyltetrahydrofolate cyclo-ligase [Peptococcaceae bacterium BRH_c23]KJS85247.1 MAG: 5-formyltetrahydrofolate cyclo-ligase [Desulfosporosinus sp. BICA1-9]HBW37469.1 5-formyltetrahydrofolate cyclo-ligase [Desulfosporosinus sp.]
MNEEKQYSKHEVRKSCLKQRAAMGEKERKSNSLLIQQKVEDLPEFQKAQAVMLFLNFRDEVETTALAEATIAYKKKLILPRCAPHGILLPLEVRDLAVDLEPGAWGIREPKLSNQEVEPSVIDLIIVPGAGFDLQGNRLGYGGGFYDRFFMLLNPLTPKVALSFECQVISQVPVDQHDIKMTMLITERTIYNFSTIGIQ